MQYHELAFFMGLFGSVHCVAMCGPLIFAVDNQHHWTWPALLRRLAYQLGRISMYSCLGLLLGAIGNLTVMQSGQQLFSVAIGLIMLTCGLLFLFGKRSAFFSKVQGRVLQPVVQLLSRWLYRPGGAFIAGLLNGILPCGMVYIALLSAMNADSAWNGALFMLFFGVGTLPLLLIFSLIISVPKSIVRKGFAKMIPYLYLLIGIWFVLRGANLDIPYLSPLLHVKGAIHCA